MRLMIALILPAALTACASSPANVVPFDGGYYETYASDSSREDARNSAIDEARRGCQERHGGLVVQKIGTEYQGLIDEESADKVELIGEVVSQVTPVRVPTLSRDYHVTVRFRCDGPG